MLEWVASSELAVFGLAEAVVWQQLIGRGAAGLLDQRHNGADLLLAVVDSGDDRRPNDDEGVRKPTS